jgi:hypothetical protein
VVATSRLSFVECGAAFARARLEDRASKRQLARSLEVFDDACQDLVVVELDERIATAAVRIAQDHPLRASDAIHLASARAVAPAAGSVAFACFDRRLWDAAGALVMERFPIEL